MAYVEVKAKTVELAVEAAMRELGVSDRESVDIKVLQGPERGLFGLGGRDAIVKVEKVEEKAGDRKDRKSGSGRGRSKGRSEARSEGRPQRGERKGNEGGGQGREKGGGPKPSGRGGKGGNQPNERSRNRGGNGQGSQRSGGGKGSQGNQASKADEDREDLSVEAQEPLVREFLSGLVGAFGLEGKVETQLDEGVVVAKVIGDQTEALVGPRGSVMEAIHELTKTRLQRTARDSARVRLDVAGYAERRRQALSIYAEGLIEQVIEDGGEIMLEPMSASDRKVIHDAVANHDEVRSYSEGESPKRYVVIAKTGNGDEEE